MTVNGPNGTGPVTGFDVSCTQLLMLKPGRNVLGSSDKKLLVSEQMQWRTAVKTQRLMVPQKVGNLTVNCECVPLG